MNYFIGELPPPFGGVAVKNSLLYKEIYEPIGVRMLNLVECKWHPWKIPIVAIRMIIGLLISKHIIIGVGTDKRLKILLQLRKLLKGKKGLSRTIVIIMGGKIHESTQNDIKLASMLKEVQSIWVETNGMKISLEKQDFSNVKIFPNCRKDENKLTPGIIDGEIKYVYFSRICEEKGVDDILRTVDDLNSGIKLDFYGEIAENYKERFFTFIKSHPNIKYHGVFDSSAEDAAMELNQYDAMLLPTKWCNEGIPGAIVEAKMAGIATIVSDWNYNTEIVADGIEGIIIREPLESIINSMTPEKMMQLKRGSFDSRKRFSISTYSDDLIADIL